MRHDEKGLERDIQAIARLVRREVAIDHSRIPRVDLRIAMENAQGDPDGQVFPWLPGHPLVGSTVYYEGQLWTAGRTPSGRGARRPTAIVHLVGEGHDDEVNARFGDLRPVTWTQRDEGSFA